MITGVGLAMNGTMKWNNPIRPIRSSGNSFKKISFFTQHRLEFNFSFLVQVFSGSTW